ncbi:hypothetical protein ON010_g698 [Phytophthora cinnamomi]|nr:hypothetical protein ON010_g698 [Phytophthora cinnamomi]
MEPVDASATPAAAAEPLLERQDFVGMNRGASLLLSAMPRPPPHSLSLFLPCELRHRDARERRDAREDHQALAGDSQGQVLIPAYLTQHMYRSPLPAADVVLCIATLPQQAGDLRVASCGQSGGLEAAGQCREGGCCEASITEPQSVHWTLLTGGGQVIPELVALTEQNPSLRDGALSSSLEEYAEAKCFCYYLDTKRLLPRRDVPVVQKNEYLGGVIDFTGEMTIGVAAVVGWSEGADEVRGGEGHCEGRGGGQALPGHGGGHFWRVDPV